MILTRPAYRLVRYAFGRISLLYVAAAAGMVAAVIELGAIATLYPLTQAMQNGQLPENSAWKAALSAISMPDSLRTLVALFLCFVLLRTVTTFASQALANRAGRLLLAHLCGRAFEKTMCEVPIREIDRKGIGFFVSLAGDEANRACQLVVALVQILPPLMLAALYFISIVWFSQGVALAVLAVLAVAGLSFGAAMKRTNRLAAIQIAQSRNLNGFFVEGINGVRSIRALVAEGHIARHYAGLIRDYARTLFKLDVLMPLGRVGPAAGLLFLTIVLVLGVPGRFFETLDAPFVVTIIALLLRFFPAVGQLASTSARFVADQRTAPDIVAHLDGPPKQDATGSALSKPISSIRVDSVSFAYEPEKPVLRGLNLAFERRRSYGIVGPTGCGKSTLLDLLLRFYEPLAGRILIDLLPISQVRPEEVRRRILLVGQYPALFSDTIRANLCLGSSFSQSEIETACRRACIHEDIMRMTTGYETVISYQAGNLSGGQRQRIAIARALLRNPDVLILDESTNALDGAVRDGVVNGVLEAFRDRIVIFVTHDTSIAAKVDETFDLGALVGVQRTTAVAR